MTEQELKKAIKENDKESLVKMLSPVLDRCAEMLCSGVLKKNVIRFLENSGIKGAAAINLADVAEVRAEAFR